MSLEVLQAIDSLVKREQRIYGWGWVMAKGAEVVELRLVPSGANSSGIECALAGEREDVTNHFGLPGSRAMGYVIVGSLPEGSFEWNLVATTNQGSIEVNLPGFPEAFITVSPNGNQKIGPALQRIRGKVARDGVEEAVKRIKEVLVSRIGTFLPTKRRGMPKVATIVIDHDMGGGANRFRRELCDRLMAEGREVLLIHPELKTLSYRLKWLNDGKDSEGIVFEDIDALFDALGSVRITEAHLSDLVSFDSPTRVLAFLSSLRTKKTRLVAYLNDYYSICPSWTLTNSEGRFCGVPGFDTCAACLPNLRTMFGSFTSSESTVRNWRDQWHAFLQYCEEITAFSNDSRRIFAKAFPDLAERVVVRPHRVDYLRKAKPVGYHCEGTLRVGVLGHLNGPKGAGMLREMIRLADDRGENVEFVVFGSMERPPESPRLKLAGGYDPNSLPDLFEANNITTCFLPSVCSETFSYVTAEIMHFEMPLAVFPLGAPAERMADYNAGCVLSSMSPDIALEELLSFGRDMAANRMGVKPNCVAGGT